MGQHGKHRILVIRAILLAVLVALAPPVARATCSTALVLGLDVSSSVDSAEYRLQINGLADAFRSRPVQDAILSGPGDGILVSAFEWSGMWQQHLLADWTWIVDRRAIELFADLLQSRAREREMWPTALGRASEFAAALHRRAPRECWRKVIDISGDGVNNAGVGPDWYRARGDFEGLVINGLVIRGADPDPLGYYLETVIHGPGAFVEVADSYAGYSDAIERKLVRELTSPLASDR